jgi:methionine synthase I (cobalamin-dependent)
MNPGECGTLWNVEHPADVEAIHGRYAAAGCDFATTNTFGGTQHALAKYGLESRLVELNQAGVARVKAGAPGCWVLADMGPFGDFLEPLGDTTEDEATAMFKTQALALAEGGADGIIIETMTDAAEMRVAVLAAKTVGLPIIATFAFDRADGITFRTMMGADVPTCISTLIDAGADVVGANCGASMGLDDYNRLADSILTYAQGKPVILQPNAGAPQMVNGELTYDATPQDMADLAIKLVKKGVKIVGGCCGTTPDHLKAIATAVKG